jgi:hypothetical protein
MAELTTVAALSWDWDGRGRSMSRSGKRFDDFKI